MGNLSNLFISASFQSLLHLGNDSVISSSLVGIQDGFGNSVGIAVNSAGDLSISGSLTSSLQQGYVWVGNASGKTTTVPTSSFGGGGGSDLTSLNAFTASQQILNAKTAYTGSNTFNGNQIVNGAVTASTAMIAGLHYPSADNGAESFIQTDGAGNLSLQYVKTMYQNIRNRESVTIQKGTPLFASGSTGDNVDVYIADAGNPNRMPATLIAGDTSIAAGATGKGIIFGHIEGVDTNAYPAGTEVYVGVGGGWTATRPTGSTTPIQPLGVVTRQGNNGMGIVMTETPYDLPNLQTGYAWVGNGSNQPVAVATSSFSGGGTTINTGSFATTGSNVFVGEQYINGGRHLQIQRSATGANQYLRLGPTDNENNFAFIVTGSDTNPGQQVWGINIGGSTWANSFDAGVAFNSYVSASNGLQIGRGTDDGIGKVGLNISRLSGQTGIQINQTGVGASWFVGTRENNNGNLIISSSANDRYIEFASSSGWMEVYANQTNFNQGVSFRGLVNARNIQTDLGNGYVAQFDSISGSNANITGVMNLTPNNPLPAGKIGDLAVSGSNLYFYNGSWTLVI
jgi:hypothetical protein